MGQTGLWAEKQQQKCSGFQPGNKITIRINLVKIIIIKELTNPFKSLHIGSSSLFVGKHALCLQRVECDCAPSWTVA